VTAQQRPKAAGLFAAEDLKVAGKAHVWLYRRTGGKVGGKWRIGAGFRKPVPTRLLEHRGRKSGKVFVTPLLSMFDGADVVIAASQGGRPEDPQWYRNRRWPKLAELHADFDNYQSGPIARFPWWSEKPR
jgi:F420H(2)-dependent quinone reductase